MSADVINKIKGLIDSIVPEIETLDISFFGGEPLLEFSRIVEPLIVYAENVTASHMANRTDRRIRGQNRLSS